MNESEGKQLDAFVSFIKSDPTMHKALINEDWPTFAYHYNGPSYKENDYDNLIKNAYASLKRGN